MQHDACAIDATRNNVIGVDEQHEARAHNGYADDDVNPREPPLQLRGRLIPFVFLSECCVRVCCHIFYILPVTGDEVYLQSYETLVK